MKLLTFADIYTPELAAGAIINDEFQGFKEDYLLLHCLLKIHQPKTVFEIGTNMGTGTNIICNAVPDAQVFSLDLPTELAHISLQHPISEGKGDSVGHKCKFPYEQLRGDSMTFDFSKYPCEAYFIDGEHDYDHVAHETKQALLCNPQIIIYHDANMIEVLAAIVTDGESDERYQHYLFTDTRIAYLLKK